VFRCTAASTASSGSPTTVIGISHASPEATSVAVICEARRAVDHVRRYRCVM
jgi:hypothetical protein